MPALPLPGASSHLASTLAASIRADGIDTEYLRVTHNLSDFVALCYTYTVGTTIYLVFIDRTYNPSLVLVQEHDPTDAYNHPIMIGNTLLAILDANPTYDVALPNGHTFGWSGGKFTVTATIDAYGDPLTGTLLEALEDEPVTIPI